MFGNWSQQTLLGNSWERWAAAFVIFFLVMLLAWAVRAFGISRLRKMAHATDSIWDDLALLLLERTKVFFVFLVALHFSAGSLTLGPKGDKISNYIFILVLFVQIGLWANHAINFIGNTFANRALERDAGRATTIRAMLFFGKVFSWALVILLLLDNWGIKVAPFIAGLGIGGIAIALAVQNVLGDLLASLSIVMDKPFVIGDAINVGTETGVVEHVGLKTTRLKSINGEQLIFSNSDLLQSRIRNFKRMSERRVVVKIGVLYETPPDKLDLVRQLIDQAVRSTSGLRFERAHLANFGDSALEYELVYWVNSPDYNVYIDLHHKFSVALIRLFLENKVEFAYPTQKLFVEVNRGLPGGA